MSSAVLYLAIVAVWGIVLVPMWLRRDGDGIGRLLHRRPLDAPEDFETSDEPDVPEVFEVPDVREVPEVVSEAPVRRRRVTRGAVIARRRRRTLGLSLLTLTAVIATATQLAPWWFMLPPVVLLAGHLSLLRVAVRMDHARRAEARRAAAVRAARLRRAAEEREAAEAEEAWEAERTAEVIELPGWAREEVYDQYTDLRAVGD
jgi:hypothetical protein